MCSSDLNPVTDLWRQLRTMKPDRDLWRANWGNAGFWFVATLVSMNMMIYAKEVLRLTDSENGLLNLCPAKACGEVAQLVEVKVDDAQLLGQLGGHQRTRTMVAVEAVAWSWQVLGQLVHHGSHFVGDLPLVGHDMAQEQITSTAPVGLHGVHCLLYQPGFLLRVLVYRDHRVAVNLNLDQPHSLGL